MKSNLFHSLNLRMTVAVAAALLLLPLAILAGPGQKRHRDFGRRGPAMMGMMFHGLNLTDEQKTQVRATMDKQKEDMKAAATALRDARQALNQAERQPEVNEGAVRDAAAKVADASLQMNLLRARSYADLYALLNDTQRQTLADRQAKMAERAEKGFNRREGKMGRRGHGHEGMNKEGAMPMFRMRGLDLTDTQRDQIKALFTDHRDTMKTRMDEFKADAQGLQQAIHQPKYDAAAVESASKQMADLQLEQALNRANMFASLHGILTPDQWQKVVDHSNRPWHNEFGRKHRGPDQR